MRILIIEDENIAAERLIGMIADLEPSFEVVEALDSVQSAVEWFEANDEPDLIFLDIRLADGLSFAIFEHVQVESPIIFTTAYDHYAIKAFKLNSIDYLLKPIANEELDLAIKKFKKATSGNNKGPSISNEVLELLNISTTKNRFKERFVIRVGEHLKAVPVKSIKLFYSEQKATYALTEDDTKYILDYALDQVESVINEIEFFRINRKYIIRLDQISDILSFSNSRLKLTLNSKSKFDDLIVARDKVQKFKSWLDN